MGHASTERQTGTCTQIEEDPNWHIIEQGAKCRGVVSLAGQDAPASDARAAVLAGDRHLCGDDLCLDRGRQPFCLRETNPEVAKSARSSRSMRATSTSDVSPAPNSVTNLTRHTSLATSSPSFREPKTYRSRNKPQRFACSLGSSPLS
jgi:hypothetical protein